MQQALTVPERQAEALGCLLVRLVFHIEQNDGLAITFRQLVEQLADADRRGIVRVRGGQRRDLRMILILVGVERDLRPALAQLGQAGVLGDRIDPGRQLRLPGEAGQGAPDPQENVLGGVFGQWRDLVTY